MADAAVEYRWRTTWFPPDAPERHYVGTEQRVRAKAAEMADCVPLIERQRVEPEPPWEVVENAADWPTCKVCECPTPTIRAGVCSDCAAYASPGYSGA